MPKRPQWSHETGPEFSSMALAVSPSILWVKRSLNSLVPTLLQITLSQCHRLSRQRVSVMQGLKNEMCGLCSNLMLNNPRVLYDKYSKIPDACHRSKASGALCLPKCSEMFVLVMYKWYACSSGLGPQPAVHCQVYARHQMQTWANICTQCMIYQCRKEGRILLEVVSTAFKGCRVILLLGAESTRPQRDPDCCPGGGQQPGGWGGCSACKACSSRPSSRCRWDPSKSLGQSQAPPFTCLQISPQP